MKKHVFVAAAGMVLALALVPGVAGAREIKTTLAEDWPDRVVEIPDSWTITDEQVAEWEAYASEETFSPEAKACYAVEGKSWILHRLYNPYSPQGEHHYTTSKDEYDQLQTIGWVGEGVFCWSASSQRTPNYRLFNPYATMGTHHYTMSVEERDALIELGWQWEGVGWYSWGFTA